MILINHIFNKVYVENKKVLWYYDYKILLHNLVNYFIQTYFI